MAEKGIYIFSVDKFIESEGKECVPDNKWIYKCNGKVIANGKIGDTIFICKDDMLDKWCVFIENGLVK